MEKEEIIITNDKKIREELMNILLSEQGKFKEGSDGDYSSVHAVEQSNYTDVIDKIISFVNSITDFENQPNQFGIKLFIHNPRVLEILNEITEGKGRYDMDKLKHASNTIEDMKELAHEAINLFDSQEPKEEGGSK